MQAKQIPEYNPGKESPISTPIVKEVWGPNPDNIMIGFRFPGASTKDARLLSLVGKMLTNGQAGLIDLDLIKSKTSWSISICISSERLFSYAFTGKSC